MTKILGGDLSSVDTNVNTLLARLTALRAGYLDEIEIIEEHLHNRERWFGKKASQTATDWGDLASLTPYRAISGNGAFGTDTDDEALVIGTADTPAVSGMVTFDGHRMLITASSNATDWVLRIIYGSGTMADAETAGQYSDVMVQEARKGSPIEVLSYRCICASAQIWIRAKNASNNAWIDFFYGMHEYDS